MRIDANKSAPFSHWLSTAGEIALGPKILEVPWPQWHMRRSRDNAKQMNNTWGGATVYVCNWWSELLHPAQILHSPAHWVGRAGWVHIERPETEWHNTGRRWNPARFATSEVLLGRKRRVACDAIMVITSADADQDRRSKCAIVTRRVKYLILHVS